MSSYDDACKLLRELGLEPVGAPSSSSLPTHNIPITDPLPTHNNIITSGLKRCPRCGIEKSITEYGTNTKAMSGYCKECRNEYSKELYIIKKNRDTGTCALCGSPARLVMDHDHKTKKLRDWICKGCNLGLGGFRDSIESLQKAIEYLKKHSE